MTEIELVNRLTVKCQHCLEHFKLAHYLAEQAFSREGADRGRYLTIGPLAIDEKTTPALSF